VLGSDAKKGRERYRFFLDSVQPSDNCARLGPRNHALIRSEEIKPMTTKRSSTIYEGLGSTIDEAIRNAHRQIPLRQGKDFVVCRVVECRLRPVQRPRRRPRRHGGRIAR
jgi:hypothetical protein